MATEELRVSALIAASPNRIYSAWMDERQHSAFTGGRATVDPWVGGRHTAWDNYVEGTLVELDTGKRIVMTWRTSEFPSDAADSRVEVKLEPVAGGTRVTVHHTDIPEGQADRYRKGWRTQYLDPMKRYFGKPGAMREALQAASRAGVLPIPGVTSARPGARMISRSDATDGARNASAEGQAATPTQPASAPTNGRSGSKKPVADAAKADGHTNSAASATKGTASRKTSAKKAPTKKAASKKTTAKKAPTKKAASKKATAKKAPTKKVSTKKTAAKKTASKNTAAAKKATSKKTAATKKASAKKTATKRTASKNTAAAKKAASKKTATAKKASGKKAVPKKTAAAKKAASKKTATAKKASASKTGTKRKAAANKAGTKRKAAAKKTNSAHTRSGRTNSAGTKRASKRVDGRATRKKTAGKSASRSAARRSLRRR